MWLLVIVLLSLSGCSYIDWAGPWLGCPKGHVLKPAVRGMFGMVKYPAKCVDEAETKKPDGHVALP